MALFHPASLADRLAAGKTGTWRRCVGTRDSKPGIAQASKSGQASSAPSVAAAAAASVAAVLLMHATPSASLASNVRLQDVDSPLMKRGLQAATQGNLVEAERCFQIILQVYTDTPTST